jgi:tRNA G18 (ribose-2'-O)-methylase SpoU
MIPMHGQIQSLNVSVATGILLAQIKYQLEKYEKNK